MSSVRPPVDPETPLEQMRAWTAKALRSFLEGRDMVGPAGHLYAQGVNGMDFLELSEPDFIHSVRATPFVAKKLVRIRDAFLSGPS